jgi:hypothetical protein
MDDEPRSEEEEQERPRPRVVDKRVSARSPETRGEAAPVEPTTAGEQPTPTSPPPPAQGTPPPGEAPAPQSPTGGQVWTPEQEEQARRIADEIARAPARDLVVTMAMNFVEVATVKIDSGDLGGAQLAIDAFDAVIRELGTRLGDAEAPMKGVLAQLQMAYAQRATQSPNP